MTFSRHTASLPAFREEVELDFAVDTLEHSDKFDSGLILSCSDDRLLSSYSKPKAFVVIYSQIPTSIDTSPSHHSFSSPVLKETGVPGTRMATIFKI